MGVKIRTNKKASGVESLYLDIYQDGKRYKEYLGLHLKPARTPEERTTNKEIKRLAEEMRAKRELQLIQDRLHVIPTTKRKQDFIEYYQQFVDAYTNKDYRIVKYGFIWFIKLLESKKIARLKGHEVTPELCQQYIDFMQSGGLKGETPYNYWTKFKQVINRAMKEKLIIENPTLGIRVIRSGGVKKAILSQSEIQLLASTPCQNIDVKKAFLFSCLSGLRWVDVKSIQHSSIDRSQNFIRFTQSKTEHSSSKSQVVIPLTISLLKLIGEPGKPDEIIFNLPSYAHANNMLKDWANDANIQKNITWHSARHSFAVNLLGDAKADIKTVADLLGHSGLKHTEKYLHVVDARKTAAMNNLNELEF